MERHRHGLSTRTRYRSAADLLAETAALFMFGPVPADLRALDELDRGL
jgi:hypothetical protein